MTKKISISFRVYKNANSTKQTLKICAKESGSTQYVPRVINIFGLGNLPNPDFKRWDQKRQRFRKGFPDSENCNTLLSAIEARCKQILSDNVVESTEEFWGLVEAGKENKAVVNKDRTFGYFLRSYIDDLKHARTNKLPSHSYQVYVGLLHHLEREDEAPHSSHIINVPVDKVSDREFKAFGNYLKGLETPNYINNMEIFKRIHNLAIKKGFAQTRLSYSYIDDAPPMTFEQLDKMSRGICSLSSDKIAELEDFDVSTIMLHCRNQEFYKQLYLDTCLLMYYIYSRPIDVLSMKVSNIKKNAQGYYLEYLPTKKKNSPNAFKSFVKVPISSKAMNIIKKYKGISKGGYLLPFSFNNYTWDLSDASAYQRRYNRCNRALGQINTFLKSIGKALNIHFDNDTFTTYIFRHTAISLAITEKNIPPIVVAKMAGTSLEEIERSYMDHTTNMFSYVD